MAQPFNFSQPSGAHTRPRFTALSIWQSSYFLKEEKGAQRKIIRTPQPASLLPVPQVLQVWSGASALKLSSLIGTLHGTALIPGLPG